MIYESLNIAEHKLFLGIQNQEFNYKLKFKLPPTGLKDLRKVHYEGYVRVALKFLLLLLIVYLHSFPLT